ncbi:MAG TPA: GntR family transcriptional regulator [Streptosporangiaceae bacterium]|nr:GntR family transcriptional regulator [Streptosporangiaceae bacterium]
MASLSTYSWPPSCARRSRPGGSSRGYPLPSINALMQEHGVAKGTAEKALRVLRNEGLARTVPGRGVYVIPRES